MQHAAEITDAQTIVSGARPVSLLTLAHRLEQVLNSTLGSRLDALEITPRQFSVIVAIAGNRGESQIGLTALTGIDRSTLADLVRRLARKGIVSRRRSRRDSRAYEVTLTVRGQAIVDQMTPLVSEAEEQLLSTLPKPERRTFLTALEALTADASKADSTRAAIG